MDSRENGNSNLPQMQIPLLESEGTTEERETKKRETKRLKARIASRKWRAAHPEDSKKANLAWRARNPEAYKAMTRTTYIRNKDKRKANCRDYYKRNQPRYRIWQKPAGKKFERWQSMLMGVQFANAVEKISNHSYQLITSVEMEINIDVGQDLVDIIMQE